MTTPQQEIVIKKRVIARLVKDNVKSAEAISLCYVNDREPGISRHKSGTGFTYKQGGKAVKDKAALARIKRLVIPPAWQEVWICATDNGHLQATGLDVRGRKQYKYHPLWNALRNEAKFFHLAEFGNALVDMRKKLNADLSLPGLPLRKVLATIVSIMDMTGIRIGSSSYEKMYGSYGLTTLKDKHVEINGSKLRLTFKGKKGVFQDLSLKSLRLARIIRQCRDIPGKELFQYYDETGTRKSVESGMVNSYIKELCGGSFTAKDFRTWAGTLYAIEAFKDMEWKESANFVKQQVVRGLDSVAARLGNTRTVCKKYYVHPMVLEHYADNTLHKYMARAERQGAAGPLSNEEYALLRMLKDIGETTIKAA